MIAAHVVHESSVDLYPDIVPGNQQIGFQVGFVSLVWIDATNSWNNQLFRCPLYFSLERDRKHN